MPLPVNLTMAQKVAKAIEEFQQKRTGVSPKAMTIVLSGETLVVTMHDALSNAEKESSRTQEGAEKIQDFHRKLFQASVEELREKIKEITGVAVSEAATEVEPLTGAVVHAFTTGTVVQVFRLVSPIAQETWHGS